MIKKKNLLLSIFFTVFALCCSFGAIISFDAKKVEAVNSVEYIIFLDSYTIENYSDGITVKDPDGITVETNGTFTCDKLGRYSIYNNGTLSYYVEVVSKPFEADFTYTAEFVNEVYAGVTYVLPKASVSTEIQDFDTYSIQIVLNGGIVSSFDDVSTTLTYSFNKAGTYSIVYYVVDEFGFRLTDTHTVEVESKKIILNAEYPSTWAVLDTIDFSAVSGYYEGLFYDVDIAVKKPDNTTVTVTNGQYIPTERGRYEIQFSANILGETITKTCALDVALSQVSLFSNRKNIESVVPSYETATNKGLEITTSGANASVHYNKVINLNHFTNDDSIVSFFCKYDELYHTKKMRVTLTDVNDPNNSISVYWRHETGEQYMHFTYMLVEFNGYALGINNDKTDWTGQLGKPRETYGAMVSESMVSRTTPLNFAYDVEEKAIYTTHANKKIVVLDMDDAEALGPTRTTWNGFSSNYVYLSFDFMDNISSSIQIQSIAGENFVSTSPLIKDDNYLRFVYNNEYVTDENQIKIEAYKNFVCKFPEPIVSDFLFGGISVDFDVLKMNASSQWETVSGVSNYAFTPTEAGQYKAVYSYVDKYGTPKTKEFAFKIADTLPPAIEISGQDITADIMSYCDLPEITVSGGIKTVEKTISVYYNGTLIEVENNRVFLDKVGEVKIKVDAVDFIGNTASETYTISVNRNKRLITVEEEPLTFVAGREYTLPDFTAIDYSFNPDEVGYEMTKTVFVGTEQIGSDLKYTPSASDEKITISYYGGYGTAAETCKTVEVRIISNGESTSIPVENYFNYDKTKTSTLLFEFGLGFEMSATDTVAFPNPIPVNDFFLDFAFIKNQLPSSVDFILTDYKNAEQSVTISLNGFANAQWNLKVNGETLSTLSYVEGAYKIGAKKGQEYIGSVIKLSNNGKSVVNSVDNVLCNIFNYTDGKDFIGFDSGLVKLQIKVNKATDCNASFVLSAASNQSFSTYSLKNNRDVQGPALAADYKLNIRYPYETNIVIPKVVGFDVLQGNVSGITLTVTKPDGTTEILDGSVANAYVFNQYGLYKFVYSAKDALGNTSTLESNITVYDSVGPTLSINGSVQTEYKVGDTIKIPTFTANDNVGVNKSVVMLQDVHSGIVFVDETYKFEKAGTYRLIFFANDVEGNLTKVIYEIKVGA